MPGPSKKSSPSLGEPEDLVLYLERLRQQAEDFRRSVEEDMVTTKALIEKLRVDQAKRRRHGRRMD